MSKLHLDERAEGDDCLLVARPKPFHDVVAGKCRLEDHQHHDGLAQDARDAENKGDAERRVPQHAGPLGRLADEGQRAQEAHHQREEQQEAQVRVVGSDDGRVPMAEEYADHDAGAEGTKEGDNKQGDAHGVSKGQELHLFGDAGCPFFVGPELRQTAHTLYGILIGREQEMLPCGITPLPSNRRILSLK